MANDPDIAAGQAARRIGRHDLAAAAFRRAGMRAESADEARRREFQALREVDISRYLIGRLLRRIRMRSSAYKGFDAIEPPLDSATVAHRLDDLAGDLAAADDRLGSLRTADLLARDTNGRLGIAGGEAPVDLSVRIAMARRDLRRGRPSSALEHIEQAGGSDVPSAAGKAILGRALWQLGNGHVAANAFNLSLLYLIGTETQGALRFQAAYKDYRIVFYRGQFYAIPAWPDPMLEETNGEARVVAHRLPRWVRDWIRHRVPAAVFAVLHRIFAGAPLRSELRLEEMLHSSDLLSVMRAVDDIDPVRR
ncbi:MAG: hypothetical protein IT562_13585 [Alphaproteobacteria bacterium]|nr:hypothetical protein [Alphaproteobacteria bacterium]